MKLAFVINKIETEKSNYTTQCLALTAHRLGHTFYMIGAADLTQNVDGCITASGRTVPDKKFKNVETFLKSLQEAQPVKINCDELDVMFIRTDPSDDMHDRPWAQNAPYMFGQLVEKHDVLVLNHPGTLSVAINKMYFQHFPEELRPKSIITRNVDEIWDFFKSQKNKIILKPLQGSGGTNVFLVEKKTEKNMNQIIDAISRDGYVIAQEYLPQAKDGDIRLMFMNGKPLVQDGQYALMARLNQANDIRSNISSGGTVKKAKMTEEIERIAEILRPKLVQDGMFFIGVDIAGDKLMEINVFSVGGLPMMNELYSRSFDEIILKAIEKKVQYKSYYGRYIDNITLATL